MHTQSISGKIAAIAVLCGCAASITWAAQSEWKLRQLAQRRQLRLDARPRNPQQKAIWLKENKRLAQLWLSHNQRDITQPLVQLLQSSQDEDVRRRIVRALGRLENPSSLRPLRMWLKRLNTAQNQAMTPTLSLALARIGSSKLKGQGKLDAVAKGVGLSWREVARLSKKINAPHSNAQGTPGDEIVEEMVDVIYHMGKQGQNIQAFASQLVISPAEKVILQVAPLTKQQEIIFLLDYSCGLKGSAFGSEYLLENHLPVLGREADALLLSRLQAILRNPQNYPSLMKGHGDFSALFRGAATTGDKRFLPILKEFENKFQGDFQRNSGSVLGWTYFYASQSREALEYNSWHPVFP